MKRALLISALTLALAAPVVAQDAPPQEPDATPEGQMVEGLIACIMGKGDPAATEAILAPFGWTSEVDAEAGVVAFYPAVGEATYAYMASTGEYCQVESLTIGTEAAFQIALAGMQGAEITVTANEKDDLGCDGARLSTGARLSLTSGGNDPTCNSDTDSALRAIFAPAQ